MSKKTTYLLGILLTIIIGTLLYCYLCDTCYCCPDSSTNIVKDADSVVEKPEVKAATLNSFLIKDSNGDFNFNSNDNFNFNASNFNILEPISTTVDNGVLKLKDYLTANPLKDIDITGYYTSDEKNNSAFPNLGLARANAIKNYFVSKGIPSKQIDIFGKLNDGLVPDDKNIYYGPVSFDFLTLKEGDTAYEDALKTECETVKANPLVLHFNTGQAQINLTVEQREKIAHISRCVDKLGARVQVVGHTDNTGDAAANVGLGQKRADFAKAYLIRNGILESTIDASSKGQAEPIADNATEEGKSKNRRTVVTIN